MSWRAAVAGEGERRTVQERVVEHGGELAPEPGEGQADRQREDVVVEHLDQQPASQPAANVTQGFWVLQRSVPCPTW